MDDNGYDDGNFELIASTELIVQRDSGPFMAVTKHFAVDSASNENAELLLDPLPALRRRFPEIDTDFKLTVLRTNAEVPRLGPHRAIWQATIDAEAKQVDATVKRVV
jgi:hypothetical protein